MVDKRKEIAAFVRNNVEFFEERLQLALNKMDRMRCPLSFADEEWCDDNEVCYDEVDWDDAIDGEDGIIWQA